MKGSNPACEVKVKLVKEEGELQIMVTFINSVEEVIDATTMPTQHTKT